MSNTLLEAWAISEVQATATGLELIALSFVKEHSTNRLN